MGGIRTLADHLRSAAGHKPGKPFVIADETLTYGALCEALPRIGGLCRERGWEQGDRVLIATADELAAIQLYLGLIAQGVTVTVASPEATAGEIALMIEVAQLSGAVVDVGSTAEDVAFEALGEGALARLRPRTKRNIGLVGRFMNRESSSGGLVELISECEPVPAADIVPETTAHILFTSGSTARPKAVEISHRNVFAHMATLVRQLGYDEDTRIFNPLALHHTDGITQGPVVALTCGAAVVRRPRFSIDDVQAFLDSIYANHITHFYAVPSMLRVLIRFGPDLADAFDTEDFRFIISSAEDLPGPLWRELEEEHGIEVVNLYGLTETVSGSLYSGPDEDSRAIGSLGKPVDCEVRIVGDDGRELGTGKTGELLLRGPHVTKGYFGDATANREAFTEDGWFRTGDLVRRDKKGIFWLRGRKKNLINRGGVKISPEEIAKVLEADPTVHQAAVVPLSDEALGEQVIACVVARAGRSVDLRALREHCRKKLSMDKQPSRIRLVAELPLGATGKVDRAALIAMLEEDGDDITGVTEVGETVRSLAARCFGHEPDALSATSAPENTPGWSSMAHMDFVVALEGRFGLALSAADIARMSNLEATERLIRRRVGR